MISDLQVKEERMTIVRPPDVRERRSLYLSNIDQSFVAYVIKFVYFFSMDPETSSDAIIYFATEALSKILSAYDFICGRLAFNSQQQRFEIDCNNAGVPLVFCTSQLSLEALGDISYPNPAFSQLFYLPGSPSSDENRHLISFQVTRFTGRGLALGTAVNHCLMDGFALQEFARNFTHLVTTGELAFIPVTDRTSLKARSPPQVKFQHLEYVQPSDTAPDFSPFMPRNTNTDLWQKKLTLNSPSDKHVFRMFTLSGETISFLKAKAMNGGVNYCSSFMAALAHVWRARSAALASLKPNHISTVHFAVDIRSKLQPPLPREFAGNATFSAYAKATGKELHELPLAELVRKLQEGADRLSDEYLRSAIDWKELNNGVPYLGEHGFLVTSWSHMRFQNLQVGGFAELLYGGVVVSGRVNVVVFLANPEEDGGMKIYIALQHAQMAMFENLILDVDANNSVKCKL